MGASALYMFQVYGRAIALIVTRGDEANSIVCFSFVMRLREYGIFLREFCKVPMVSLTY